MKNGLLYAYRLTIVMLFSITLNACASSEQASQESVQTALAETQQTNELINTAVASTLDSVPAEIPPTSTASAPAYDYSSWKGYHAPEGYFFNYPFRFNLEVRQGGEGSFVVLVAEGSPPNEISFSVRSILDYGNLGEIRDVIDLDNPVFTDLSSNGMTGFIVEGTVPGDGFGGGSVVYQAYFELGDLLVSLDCPWNFCDRQEFDLILRSFKLEG